MTSKAIPRDGHPYYMYDAVRDQPDAIGRVLDQEQDAVEGLADMLAAADRIHVVGIGTSWHAALVGEHALRTIAGRRDARAWNSFEFCLYPPYLAPGDAVIVMSHRGTKTYSAMALELAKSRGAQTAVITGLDSDANTDLADHVVRTSYQELSSAFTISHTTAMTALLMTAVAVGSRSGAPGAEEVRQELAQLPELVEQALALEPEISALAKSAVDAERMYFAGWGPNASTAYETALKIKETSYLMPEGFELEQYLHGPFVATHPGCFVTFIAPPGPGKERAKTLMEAAGRVNADTVALIEKTDNEVPDLVKNVLRLPITSEPLTPIVYLAPLQLLTYHLALQAERNPDVFRLDDPRHAAAREKYQL